MNIESVWSKEKQVWLNATKQEMLRIEKAGGAPYYCAVMWCSCGGRALHGCECECHEDDNN